MDLATDRRATTSPPTSTLAQLAAGWRTRATDLRRLAAAEGAARAFELAAEELQEWLTTWDNQLLNVADAAQAVGRHRDTVGNAVRSGRLTNHGTKHRPRVRRGELLHIFPPSSVAADGKPSYDPVADARSILRTRRGG
jgi:hypothetical protein